MTLAVWWGLLSCCRMDFIRSNSSLMPLHDGKKNLNLYSALKYCTVLQWASTGDCFECLERKKCTWTYIYRPIIRKFSRTRLLTRMLGVFVKKRHIYMCVSGRIFSSSTTMMSQHKDVWMCICYSQKMCVCCSWSSVFKVRVLYGIPALVQLFTSDNQEVQRYATGATRNLIYENSDNKVALIDAGGLARLVSILSEQDEELRKIVTGSNTLLVSDRFD